jgi:hypothetical protein
MASGMEEIPPETKSDEAGFDVDGLAVLNSFPSSCSRLSLTVDNVRRARLKAEERRYDTSLSGSLADIRD